MTGESLTVEYKREYFDEIKKTIIAFANTDGGELLIGVDDDGTVLGVDDPDDVMLKVTNSARDTIKPDVTMFMRVETRVIQGKKVVAASVQRGTACPYYLSAKGVRPEGVYVRQGASTVPATESAILKMILETSGDSFEDARSLIQTLTFHSVQKTFAEEKVAFGETQKRTLGLIGEDGAYTNLGLLLSDQCQHTIKLAVFQGSTKNTLFKDRAEFSGSLFDQLDDAYVTIDRYNATCAEFKGLKRIDTRDYPPEAVREALLNAVVHRDYSYSGSTLISIYDDRIEFLSLGGLVKGIAKSDVMMGVSVPRNKKLANVFYRLHLIEAFGTGMLKIKESYDGRPLQDFIEISDNAFKITLPNVNAQRQNSETERLQTRPFQPLEQQIMDYIKARNSATRAEVQKALGLSQSAAGRKLKELVVSGMLMRNGEGRSTAYSMKKES
ncbi:MAG: putative DNA binding domain-containing protein [Pyramidobacter sp.]|uniref:RNA-binding domain-containing protein n=1 Tax=Pyramidobacter sp. TaxID=1943581 RepID=UPI002A80CAC7|nr:RNA-binding domain-containing protein [Pyramidobacter sp.]MDY4032393.1 putative DNA binding domain-containing protein [Pyramidobacter sp.]